MESKHRVHVPGKALMLGIVIAFTVALRFPLAPTSHAVPTANASGLQSLGDFQSPGDWKSPGHFVAYAEGSHYQTFGVVPEMHFSPTGMISFLSQGQVGIEFVDANPAVQLRGEQATGALAHSYHGNQPDQWQTDLPIYGHLTYKGLYNGIDLSYTFQEGKLKSQFTVQAGASLTQIHIRYTGVQSLSLADGGQTLRVDLPGGSTLLERIPAAYQEFNGQRRAVTIVFKLLDDGTYGFAARGPFDPTRPLIIDPVLIYATYLGGSAKDEGWSIALDQQNNTYISGVTNSSDFPGLSTGQYAGDSDVFVAKLDTSGNLVYVTIFGGRSGDQGNAIVIDEAGNAYVAGETFSTDFPIKDAWQPGFAGYEDAYLVKLDADGKLIFSTFLGGTRGEEVNDIKLDHLGRVYLGGEVYSDDFPLLNPWRSATFGSDEEDGFITIFSADGTMLYSTLISAPQRDQVFRLAVDDQGIVYGTGMTSSPDFPTVNPFQSTYGGDWDDCLVFKLDPWHNQMFYATFLGGSNRDECWGIDIDETGAAYVTGYTISTDFPTVGGFDLEYNGYYEAFVTKLSPAGDHLVFSTYLGGSKREWAWDLAVDSGHHVYVTGDTTSPNFPTYAALQPHYGGEMEAFLTVLDGNDGVLLYSSYLGGSADDRGWRLVVDPNWMVHVTGATTSFDFPLQAPIQGHKAGQADIFFARFAILPTPTPTPLPSTSATIGPEGGALWLAYPDHFTLLRVSENTVEADTTFTLSYTTTHEAQGDLQGINHFFTLNATPLDGTPPGYFTHPLRLILGYPASGLPVTMPMLYRLEAHAWVTEGIQPQMQLPGYLEADIHYLGLYGVLGHTHRTYLPVVLRH